MTINKNLIKADIVVDGASYNDFKDVQDRKYYVWSVFEGYMNGAKNYGKPFKITKYSGSNQVILEMNDKTIYDSERDNFSSEAFINWLVDLYIKMINSKKDKTAFKKYM